MRLMAILLALLWVPTISKAQGMLEAQQQQALSQARVTTADPTMTTPYALPIPIVTLETLKEDGRAKATIGLARSQTNYRLTFESPIGKAPDSEANPLSLTGLGNDATAEFALSRLFLFKQYTDEQLLSFCKDNGVAPGRCSDQAFPNEQLRRQFIDIALRRRPSLLSFSAQVGQPVFEFRDRTTLEEREEKKASFKLTASYGIVFLPDNLLAINITRSRGFSASKDDTSLCVPLDDTSVPAAARCDDVTLGEPTAKEVWAMTIEWRHQRVSENVPQFGISPRVQFDLEDFSRTSVEVPIYFLQKQPDKESGASLNGGVNTGWSTESGFVARVFIGAAFKLITQ